MTASENAACFRLYSAFCAEIAQTTLEPGRKIALLNMAQGWARLAAQVENGEMTDADVGTAPPTGRGSPEP